MNTLAAMQLYRSIHNTVQCSKQ